MVKFLEVSLEFGGKDSDGGKASLTVVSSM